MLRTIQTRLTDELGIDPRPALQHLKREILNQAPSSGLAPDLRRPADRSRSGDPVLIPQARGPAAPPKPESPTGRSSSAARRRCGR